VFFFFFFLFPKSIFFFSKAPENIKMTGTKRRGGLGEGNENQR